LRQPRARYRTTAMTTSRWTRRLLAAAPLIVPLLVPSCRREAERSDPPARAEPQATAERAAPASVDSPPSKPRVTARKAARSRPPAAARSETAAGTLARSCAVERVTDGDTIRCADGRRIRLLLIDAPEMDQAPFGQRARRELARLLPERAVVQYETDRQRQDRYGRTLAYVYLPDGRMANEEMLRTGYAVVLFYKPNDRHLQRFTAVADSARRQRRGLFADTTFRCMPSDHRRKAC
jgi:endonuclease YncB( thermonuclease family)